MSLVSSNASIILPLGTHRKFNKTRSSNFDALVAVNCRLFAKSSTNKTKRRCECYDFHNKLIPYQAAWSWQKLKVEERCNLVNRDEDHCDTLITLQHPSVYTLGTGSQEKYLNFDVQNAPYDIYRTERGGEVTYHGPGQLVIYPILNLRYHKKDLDWYLRSLEEVIIRVLSSTFSIKASRHKGLTGVWVGNDKIAAIGIRVSKWITYHGVAINVTADLTPFQQIVPCGIQDRGVCCLKDLLGSSLNRSTNDTGLLDRTHDSVIREFAEVFQMSTFISNSAPELV